jgi:hypothetical protein
VGDGVQVNRTVYQWRMDSVVLYQGGLGLDCQSMWARMYKQDINVNEWHDSNASIALYDE